MGEKVQKVSDGIQMSIPSLLHVNCLNECYDISTNIKNSITKLGTFVKF
jgi:hypothetical protein